MKRLKTRSALKKRIKISGTGKFMRRKAGKSHLLAGKSSQRKRRLSLPTQVSKSERKKMERALLYGTS